MNFGLRQDEGSCYDFWYFFQNAGGAGFLLSGSHIIHGFLFLLCEVGSRQNNSEKKRLDFSQVHVEQLFLLLHLLLFDSLASSLRVYVASFHTRQQATDRRHRQNQLLNPASSAHGVIVCSYHGEAVHINR